MNKHIFCPLENAFHNSVELKVKLSHCLVYVTYSLKPEHVQVVITYNTEKQVNPLSPYILIE